MAEIGVIIVAGGAGRRMGGALPKQFMMLEQQPILARSINRIHEALPKAEIVVVLPAEHVELWRNMAARFEVAAHKIAVGGKERFHSVKNGLAALSEGVR
ncbi:MAG: 2-C-methyl-D-erythritol 4-phosphate cytidylyltransferase, partial [Rikenellaceae bacterium]|nr:2-C-methyl-D-erythritol 4-phosphate cytidylyltransferase [Rikenellaceae bacterium]